MALVENLFRSICCLVWRHLRFLFESVCRFKCDSCVTMFVSIYSCEENHHFIYILLNFHVNIKYLYFILVKIVKKIIFANKIMIIISLQKVVYLFIDFISGAVYIYSKVNFARNYYLQLTCKLFLLKYLLIWYVSRFCVWFRSGVWLVCYNNMTKFFFIRN